MSLVTSLVTKKNFWILFPKITVGDIPEMLSIKVKVNKNIFPVHFGSNFTEKMFDCTENFIAPKAVPQILIAQPLRYSHAKEQKRAYVPLGPEFFLF